MLNYLLCICFFIGNNKIQLQFSHTNDKTTAKKRRRKKNVIWNNRWKSSEKPTLRRICTLFIFDNHISVWHLRKLFNGSSSRAIGTSTISSSEKWFYNCSCQTEKRKMRENGSRGTFSSWIFRAHLTVKISIIDVILLLTMQKVDALFFAHPIRIILNEMYN